MAYRYSGLVAQKVANEQEEFVSAQVSSLDQLWSDTAPAGMSESNSEVQARLGLSQGSADRSSEDPLEEFGGEGWLSDGEEIEDSAVVGAASRSSKSATSGTSRGRGKKKGASKKGLSKKEKEKRLKERNKKIGKNRYRVDETKEDSDVRLFPVPVGTPIYDGGGNFIDKLGVDSKVTVEEKVSSSLFVSNDDIKNTITAVKVNRGQFKSLEVSDGNSANSGAAGTKTKKKCALVFDAQGQEEKGKGIGGWVELDSFMNGTFRITGKKQENESFTNELFDGKTFLEDQQKNTHRHKGDSKFEKGSTYGFRSAPQRTDKNVIQSELMKLKNTADKKEKIETEKSYRYVLKFRKNVRLMENEELGDYFGKENNTINFLRSTPGGPGGAAADVFKIDGSYKFVEDKSVARASCELYFPSLENSSGKVRNLPGKADRKASFLYGKVVDAGGKALAWGFILRDSIQKK